MDSDEDVRMEDDAPIAWPTAKGKGKAKAVDLPEEALDNDNLPWSVPFSADRLFMLMEYTQGGEISTSHA